MKRTAEMPDQPKIGIVALGNLIMGDDGIGPRAIQELDKLNLPENITLVDAGTPGLGLFSFIGGYDLLILIDAVYDEGEPGSIRTYSRQQIMAMPSGARMSPHGNAVREALALLDLEGSAPRDVVLVGVIPEDCSMGACMTAAAEAAMPLVITRVQDLIQSSGKMRD